MSQISQATENYVLDKDDPNVKEISDSYLVKMLWHFLKPFVWQLLGVFVLLITVSSLQLVLPYLVKIAVDGPITEGNLQGIMPIGAIYLSAVSGFFVLRFVYLYWLATIGQSALLTIRQELFEHIIKQDMRYFNVTPVGKIVSRMSNDIEAMTELLSTSIVLVAANMVTLAGIIMVMMWMNWRLAMISLAVIPIMIITSIFFRTKIRPIAMRVHQISAAYQAFLNEQFSGMLVVQLFNRQGKTREDFSIINKDYFDSHMGLRDTHTYYASILQLMTTFGLALVLWGGGRGVLSAWSGVTIGVLIAFIEYVRQSFDPITQLAEQFGQIQTAFSAGERIARMLSIEPMVKESDNPKPFNQDKQFVHFNDVTFGYDPANPVLKNISLSIEHGQKVAIVGATGAGKTTLVKLLARYYDVNDGGIEISGIDLRDLSLADLRRLVAVVPQDPYCFNGTIGDNLRLFNQNISEEQMKAASEFACAQPFIDKLPNGFDYELLPGGANLSQGQRQLLALARALIHSPDSILVLDEATSSIDTETEALIQQGMTQVLENRTSLIIAHRLSTVRDADRIIVVKQGNIIEDGTHDELLEVGGLYAQLYYRQFADPDASIDDLLKQGDDGDKKKNCKKAG